MSDKAVPKNPLMDLFNLKPPLGPNVVKFLAVGIALGVLFINAPSWFGVSTNRGRPAGAAEVSGTPLTAKDELAALEQAMALELEATLTRIKGAGAVRVSISLEAGPQAVPVFDQKSQETKVGEKAQDGSIRDSRTVTEDKVTVRVQEGNAQSLAILQRNRARIAGVVVVAEGARIDTVKEMIHKSAVTKLGIAAHRVTVMPAEGGR